MSRSVLLVSADLMMASQFQAAAARQEVTSATALTPMEGLEKAARHQPCLIVIDLTTKELDPAAFVSGLRALATGPQQIVAFGPHVHEARLAAAEGAGCDRVMSRGQFTRQVDELLAALR
jgi:DNA-binding NarL/FixJ family response regulator